MMVDGVPVRRAASMAGIGHCSAYRIRDELNVERAAQGKPPIAANQWRTAAGKRAAKAAERSEEHTSELQSLMRISYAVFCLKKKNNQTTNQPQMQRCINTKYNRKK